jgi:hypothetical protein
MDHPSLEREPVGCLEQREPGAARQDSQKNATVVATMQIQDQRSREPIRQAAQHPLERS